MIAARKPFAFVLALLVMFLMAFLAADGAAQGVPTPAHGLMWNKTGLPGVFPLQVKTRIGKDYVLVLSDIDDGTDALAAYIRGGRFFKVLVPPGTYRVRFVTGVLWRGEDSLFGRHGETRIIEIPQPLTFEVQGLSTKAGIRTFSDLLRWEQTDLVARFGGMGERLYHLARGQDRRRVSAHAPMKSISNETTFSEDTSDPDLLDGHIWRMAEKVADRAKAKNLAGRVVTLKLKRADHSLLSRRVALSDPTQLADRIYRTARDLFAQVKEKGPYRLLGCGLSELTDASEADKLGDLLDPGAARRSQAERATDAIRDRFGARAIVKGRTLR